MIPAGLLGSLNKHHSVASKATFHTLATATSQKTTVVIAIFVHGNGRGVFCSSLRRAAVTRWHKVARYRKRQHSTLHWLFTSGVAETEVQTLVDICP